jgi:hypothetical protein
MATIKLLLQRLVSIVAADSFISVAAAQPVITLEACKP